MTTPLTPAQRQSAVINCTWADVPYLALADIDALWEYTPDFHRIPRAFGMPDEATARAFLGEDVDLNASLTPAQREFAITATEILKALHRNQRRRLFFDMFPDEDTVLADGTVLYAREKYPKHLEFFEAGKKYRERAAICANRVGKTFGMGGYEMTAHLTGLYPTWWPGRVFTKPIRAWAAGKTDETTRDTVQETLMGEVEVIGTRKMVTGTGLIPGNLIGAASWKKGSPDLIDTVKIRHKSGGWSRLGFKSYARGRGSFEGTAQHVIWPDEEVPMDIYGECLIRTATTNGIVMTTFTPLDGLTEVVQQFMPEDMRPGAE